MSVKEVLQQFAAQLAPVIDDIVTAEIKRSSAIAPEIGELLKSVRQNVQGGKRLRGALVYYSYLMHGGTQNKEILKAAAAMELIHSYLLVLDDIMDRSDLRRGLKTIHAVYRERHQRAHLAYDSAHFGESIAIAGALITNLMATSVLNQLAFAPKVRTQAFLALQNQIIDTWYGQVLDIYSEVLPNVTEKMVLKVQYLKTACYTYETPLHLGAILAGAAPADLMNITSYAIPAGIAFQIQDDILGMFGQEEKLGKPVMSDLQEGKKTLLIIYALRHVTEQDKSLILHALGNPDITMAQFEAVKQAILNSGALEHSRRLARKYVRAAQQALDKMNHNGQYKDFLRGIVEYMIERDV